MVFPLYVEHIRVERLKILIITGITPTLLLEKFRVCSVMNQLVPLMKDVWTQDSI